MDSIITSFVSCCFVHYSHFIGLLARHTDALGVTHVLVVGSHYIHHVEVILLILFATVSPSFGSIR